MKKSIYMLLPALCLLASCTDNTSSSTESIFNVTISGESLIQNDMIGDISLKIGKSHSTGKIAGIFAQMVVASIINLRANFTLETQYNSIEFSNNVGTNVEVTSSNYSTNNLKWGF